jgi:hypothetical protein
VARNPIAGRRRRFGEEFHPIRGDLRDSSSLNSRPTGPSPGNASSARQAATASPSRRTAVSTSSGQRPGLEAARPCRTATPYSSATPTALALGATTRSSFVSALTGEGLTPTRGAVSASSTAMTRLWLRMEPSSSGRTETPPPHVVQRAADRVYRVRGSVADATIEAVAGEGVVLEAGGTVAPAAGTSPGAGGFDAAVLRVVP